MSKNKNLKYQKGGVLAIILFIVIAFSILLASGQLLNKTFIQDDQTLPVQPSPTP